jgi:hypothetical protein
MSWLFSRALVEACSGASSSGGRRCAQLNVMPTPQPFWRADKPMDFSRRSQFGQTCARLTAARGAELLTSFLAASRARTSALRAEAPGSTASAADYGARWPESFARWDRAASLWRTPQCSLLEGLDVYSETWPRWGTMRAGECSAQSMPALLTSGNEFGSLPTPTATGYGSNQSPSSGAAMRPSLQQMSRQNLWPTPNATEGNGGGQHPSKRAGHQLRLRDVVKMWPTPTTKGNHNRKGASAKSGDGLATAVSQTSRCAGGSLNPDWVEWLMGWPIGWTDLKRKGTVRYRQWLRSHGKS